MYSVHCTLIVNPAPTAGRGTTVPQISRFLIFVHFAKQPTSNDEQQFWSLDILKGKDWKPKKNIGTLPNLQVQW